MSTLLAALLRRGPFSTKRTSLPGARTCDWIAIDFETANETRGSACAVGVVQFKDGQPVGAGGALINPEQHFNPYNTMVHGLDEDSVRRALRFPEVWSDLAPLLDGQVVVAHNLSFDAS